MDEVHETTSPTCRWYALDSKVSKITLSSATPYSLISRCPRDLAVRTLVIVGSDRYISKTPLFGDRGWTVMSSIHVVGTVPSPLAWSSMNAHAKPGGTVTVDVYCL